MELMVGSVWRSTNPGHPPETVKIVGVNHYTVRVRNIDKASRQHRHRLYSIPRHWFLSRHQRLK